jgi:hypothetical protein
MPKVTSTSSGASSLTLSRTSFGRFYGRADRVADLADNLTWAGRAEAFRGVVVESSSW